MKCPSRRPFRALTLITLFVGVMGAAHGQPALERIVAVVGKEIVTQSDVDGQIEVLLQRDKSIRRDDPAVRQAVLDQLINERLIMTKAQEDSVEPSEEMVTERMEQQLAYFIQMYGSEKRFEDVYGMSIARIRREFRDEIRKQLMVKMMLDRKFSDVKATRGDVENFFNRFRDSLPTIPPRVDLYHIVKYVKASDEQRREALELAGKIRDSIVAGAPFADFARRYSGDPGSAANGGDLGFVERGKFVTAFENAAFALEPGEISLPIETPFGYHVIQLIEKTTSAINCRHILLKVGQSDADKEAAQAALKDIKKRVEGGEDFEKLARDLSDERESAGFGGAMGQIEFDRMPDELRSTLMNIPDKGVSEPLPYVADPTKPGYHVLYKKGILPEHKATLESDYKLLETMATREKRSRLELEFVEELRKTVYWEVRK